MTRIQHFPRSGFLKLVSETDRNERLLSWFLVFVTMILLVSAYRAGLAAGLDSYIGKHSGGTFLNGVCTVATKWLTGIGNYVCLGQVGEIMKGLGLTAGGPQWPGYLSDREFLDQALGLLFARPQWEVPPTTSGFPYFGITGVGWGMDNGYADFVNLAFHVFGPSIESFYRTYWLVCGISYLLYTLAYRGKPVPLMLLAVAAFVQYIIFSSDFLWSQDFVWHASQNAHIHGPDSPRFLSSLCIVPALHFLCATWSANHLGRREAVLLGLQGIVLCFAIHQRTTVYWVVFAALIFAVMQWVFFRKRTPVMQQTRYARILLLLLGLAVLNVVYTKAVTHPGLAARGYTATHTLWGSLFYSLQGHPDWKARYDAEFGHNEGDGVAAFAWKQYLARHPEEGEPFKDSDGQVTQALVEQMTKKAFAEFFRKDPFFVLDMYVRYNPQAIYEQGKGLFRVVGGGIPFVIYLSLALFGFVFGLVFGYARTRLLFMSVVFTAILSLASCLPSWATLVIATSLTDFFLLLLITWLTLMVALGAGGGLLFRRRFGLP